MTTRELLEAVTTGGIPVKILTKDGQVLDCEFNGYYDWDGEYIPSIGYPGANGMLSHGILRPGDRLLTEVPSPEEWLKRHESLPKPANWQDLIG